jgi:hypothetical protein
MTILHPTIIAKAGTRDRRTPAFLSRNQFRCPRCGRVEYGNVHPDRVKMCSLCTTGLCMGKQENPRPEANQETESPKPSILRRSKPARICERCGESFRAGSNRHRFCERCQKWATNDRWNRWHRERKKNSTDQVSQSNV